MKNLLNSTVQTSPEGAVATASNPDPTSETASSLPASEQAPGMVSTSPKTIAESRPPPSTNLSGNKNSLRISFAHSGAPASQQSTKDFNTKLFTPAVSNTVNGFFPPLIMGPLKGSVSLAQHPYNPPEPMLWQTQAADTVAQAPVGRGRGSDARRPPSYSKGQFEWNNSLPEWILCPQCGKWHYVYEACS